MFVSQYLSVGRRLVPAIPRSATTLAQNFTADAHLCQTRQIHQRQTQHMWRIYLQINRGPINSLVVTRNPSCLRLNLFPYLVKVIISSPGLMQELSKLGVLSSSFWRVGIFTRWFIGGYIDKLQDQWAAGNDARTTRQEVTTNDVLEDRGFATGLGTNYDLRTRT